MGEIEAIIRHVRANPDDLRLALRVGEAHADLCASVVRDFGLALKERLDVELANDGYIVTSPPLDPNRLRDEWLHIARTEWAGRTWISLVHEWGDNWLNRRDWGLFFRLRQPTKSKNDDTLTAARNALIREFGGRAPTTWSAWKQAAPSPYGNRDLVEVLSRIDTDRDAAVKCVAPQLVAITRVAGSEIGKCLEAGGAPARHARQNS